MTAVDERELDGDGGDVLWTTQQVIDLLAVGRHTLSDWAAECWGPPVVDLSPPGRLKRTLRYYRRDVLQWVESRKLWQATV